MLSRTLLWSNHVSRSLSRCALLLMAACVVAACGGDDGQSGLTCVASLPTSCTPDLDPTFDSLYTSVFSQRCSASTCHGKNGNAMSDLKLSDATTAYQALLGQNGGTARVIPGDPHCSPLMERLESDDPKLRMPYMEEKLPAGQRCAIQQWIEKGAPK